MTDDEGEKFWLDYWYFDANIGGNGDVRNGGRKQQQSTRMSLRDEGTATRGLIDGGWGDAPKDKVKKTLGNARMDSSTAASLYPPFPLHGNITDEDGADKGREAGNEGTGMSLLFLGRSLSQWTARDRGNMFGKRSFKCPFDTEPCMSIDRPNSCCGKGSKCIFVKDTGLGDVGCCGAGESCSDNLIRCASGYTPCPDNPGGGCCIPGYSCVDQGCIYISTTIVTATPAPPPPSTFTEPINPPVRPTSNAKTTITTFQSTRPTITGCPTGFYACSAVYHGGCCRTGRDCNPTSCPPISSTTIVDDNGATIVIGIDPTVSLSSPGGEGRRCAAGWTGCAASAGGGCCPDGFACAEISCTLSAGGRGTAVVGKMAPVNGAGKVVVVGGWANLTVVMMVMAMMQWFMSGITERTSCL
ncbi:GPI anchored protein [Histoplasma capsulatum]|uniref:GPI anchored protein n=1 Tax=Ajellomyces capsulatus TaxID=5037 RepID=A0A8A1MIE7_AJECA|nr:GPI anchored protein [Histoplasma capsulatum]